MELKLIHEIGAIIEYLKRAAMKNFLVKNEDYVLDNLKRLLTYLEKNNLSNTTQQEVKKTIEELDKKYNENQNLDTIDSYTLERKTEVWRDRILNELENRPIIEIFTDSTLNYKKLISGPQTFFDKKIWERLSNISSNGLSDATLCLLVQAWTPAVMISLRVAEDIIRKYYKFKTKKSPEKMNIGSIIKSLEKIPDVKKNLLGYLNYIKELRNSAEHPDKIFNQNEAERAFHEVINFIHFICEEMSKKRK